MMQFFTKNKIERLLASYGIPLIGVTIFLKENFNSMSIILAFGATLFLWKNFNIKTFGRHYSVLVIYLLSLVGLLWTSEIHSGLGQLRLYLPFIVLPFIFSTVHLKKEDIKHINRVFMVATVVFLCFLLIRVSWIMIANGSYYYLDDRLRVYYYFVYTRLNPYIHPTYVSMFIVYFLYYILFDFKGLRLYFRKFLYVIIGLLLLFLVLLMARAAQVFFVISILIYFIKYWRKFKRTLLSIVVFFAVSITLLFVYKDSNFVNRYSRFLDIHKLSTDEFMQQNESLGYRYKITKTVLENAGDRFLTGHGTASQKSYLKSVLSTSPSNKVIIEKELNSHNQLIAFFIQWGVLGILLFFFLFADIIRTAKKSGCVEMVYFGFFLFLLMLTENVLIIARGLIFVTFIYCLLKQLSFLKLKEEREISGINK